MKKIIPFMAVFLSTSAFAMQPTASVYNMGDMAEIQTQNWDNVSYDCGFATVTEYTHNHGMRTDSLFIAHLFPMQVKYDNVYAAAGDRFDDVTVNLFCYQQ